MGKIYSSLSDFEEAQEKEFRDKVLEVAYYQGDKERTTLDGEWTESELKDDVYSEALRILNGEDGKPGWLEKNKYKALYDMDFTHAEFIAEKIATDYDLVEVYNRAYDKHRNDKPMLFGIHYFDELARAEVNKILNNNLVKK